MDAKEFTDILTAHGYTFYTGVPCSYLSAFIRSIPPPPRCQHVPAVREDIALGIASGVAMSGQRSVVYMQNSGLGYSLEVFASLNLIYKIPLLVAISYRGPADPGMEEHLIMGRQTETILQAFSLPYVCFDTDRATDSIDGIVNEIAKKKLPGFLLIGKGDLA